MFSQRPRAEETATRPSSIGAPSDLESRGTFIPLFRAMADRSGGGGEDKQRRSRIPNSEADNDPASETSEKVVPDEMTVNIGGESVVVNRALFREKMWKTLFF